MLWYDFINYGLLIIIWVIIFLKLKKNISQRKFWVIYFGIYTLTEIISLPFLLSGVNNLWLYNVSKPLQFLFIFFYFKKISNVPYNKYLLIFFIFIITFFRLATKLNDYNSIEDLFYSGFILIFSVNFFFQLLRNDNYVELKNTEFWVCSSLLFFYGLNLCITGTMNFLLKTQIEIAQKLYYILVASSYIFYIAILYALINSTNKKYNER